MPIVYDSHTISSSGSLKTFGGLKYNQTAKGVEAEFKPTGSNLQALK
jgi:hypothetical protein